MISLRALTSSGRRERFIFTGVHYSMIAWIYKGFLLFLSLCLQISLCRNMIRPGPYNSIGHDLSHAVDQAPQAARRVHGHPSPALHHKYPATGTGPSPDASAI